MSTTTSDIAAGDDRGKVTPEMQAAWAKFDPVIPNTPSSRMRDAVLLQQGFYGGWLAEASNVASGWQPIETAPKDGTMIDLWIDDGRHTNAYWGRPHHTCGEAGRYCDCCPSYDAWVCADLNAYLTGEEGYAEEPTHWMPLPSAPSQIEEG